MDMFFGYVPQEWYWLADDKRVYSGPQQMIVTENDPGFVAWKEAGRVPTIWPRELEGEQTNGALQDVIGPHGMFVDLGYYTTDVRTRTLFGGIVVNGLPFATDPLTVGSLNSAYIYVSDKEGIETFSWKLPDGTFITLDKDSVKSLQNAVSKLGQDCFSVEADTLDAIDAGTITTRAQVDAAFAAIQTDFTGTVAPFKVRRPGRQPRK